MGLNPCFSGSSYRSVLARRQRATPKVLILVLVEVPIGAEDTMAAFMRDAVLILVLVEVPIGDLDERARQTGKYPS